MGWDWRDWRRYMEKQIISIHPPRMGWDVIYKAGEYSPEISIHPPRMGWDLFKMCVII